MRKNLSILFGVCLIFLITWAFVGIERMVGDHEVGVSWEPFIKQRVDFRWQFKNPVQRGLDLLDMSNLSAAQKQELVDFCSIRFGEVDMDQCYKIIKNRMY
jgi:hypothetical protein